MKQCPVCRYRGEPMTFRTMFVPEAPYKPEDLVVECPSCFRKQQFKMLTDAISEWEERKMVAAKEWLAVGLLKPLPEPSCGAGAVCRCGAREADAARRRESARPA